MKAIKHNAASFDSQLAVLATSQRKLKELVNELTWDALRHSFVHGDPSLCRKLMAAIESATYYNAPKALISECLGFSHEFKKNVLETGKKMGDTAYQKRVRAFEEIESKYESVFEWYEAHKPATEKKAPTIDSVCKRIETLVAEGVDQKALALAVLKRLTLTQDEMMDVLASFPGVSVSVVEE